MFRCGPCMTIECLILLALIYKLAHQANSVCVWLRGLHIVALALVCTDLKFRWSFPLSFLFVFNYYTRCAVDGIARRRACNFSLILFRTRGARGRHWQSTFRLDQPQGKPGSNPWPEDSISSNHDHGKVLVQNLKGKALVRGLVNLIYQTGLALTIAVVL